MKASIPSILFLGFGSASAYLSGRPATLSTRRSGNFLPAPDTTSLALSPAELWTSYNGALDTAPLLTKSITAGVILGAADFTGQLLEKSLAEREGLEVSDDNIDLGRVLRFAFFGLVLQAPWNHYYYLALDGALPPTPDPLSATTAGKVVIDQFIQAPVFTVLIFYFLGLLEGKGVDGVNAQLQDKYKDTIIANWKLWVPATCVNIAFVPPPLRVLYLNCVFYFWSIYLSITLNKETPDETSDISS